MGLLGSAAVSTSTNELAEAALDATRSDLRGGSDRLHASSAGVAADAGRRNRRIVFGVSAASFLVAIGFWVVRTVQVTGSLVYALDDAYIHLAVADRLAFTGTWGVQEGVYQSASSAPAWNLLEAALLLVRIPGSVVPLVLGVAASLWALWTASRMPVVERFGSVPAAVALAAALPFSFALVSVTMMGMEHALQVAIALAVLATLADRVGGDRARVRRARWALPVLFLVGTSIRYEMLLMAGACVIAYLFVQFPDDADESPSIVARLREAATWIVAALVPVVVVAAVNLSFGQYVLPDSVIAKGRDASEGLSPLRPLLALVLDRRLIVLVVVAAAVVVMARRHLRSPAMAPLIAAVVVVCGFVTFGPVTLSWLGRYQAMPVSCLVFAIAMAAVRLPIRRPAAMSALAIAVFVPGVMQLSTYSSAVRGSEEIHLQHWQSVEFLNRWYPGGTVAFNDAGVMGYAYDGETIDLIGLTTHEVLVARVQDRYGRDYVEELAARRDIDLVVGYSNWIGSSLPQNWNEVGRWCLLEPTAVVGSECQSFFAADGAPAAQLAEHLEAFRGEMDPGITLELVDRP